MLTAFPVWGQEDSVGPTIEHASVSFAVAGRALPIAAKISDDNGVFEPALMYRIGGKGAFVSVPMEPTGEGDTYQAVIPADIVVSEVEYFIEAFDELGNGPTREGDAELPMVVRVVAAAVNDTSPDEKIPDELETAPGIESSTEQSEAEQGASVPLILGIGSAAAGVMIAAAAAATAGGVAYYFLVLGPDNTTPGEVTVTVSSPDPIAAALTRGAL